MQSMKCLAMQLLGAKQKKEDIDRLIKKLERDLLETKEASAILAPIHNEGGERTDSGITVAINRTHVWDQAKIDEVLEGTPKKSWPAFVKQETSYKIDMRQFTSFAMANPADATKWHDAHSIKFGDPKVKTINAEKLLKEED